MNIQVEQKPKIATSKPKNRGKVWSVLIGTLGITMVFTLGFFAVKNYFLKDTEISFVGTEACKVSFEIQEDSLPPLLTCTKLINGSPSTEAKPTFVEKGSDLIYTLKTKNEGSTKALVTKFEDTFKTLNSNNYIDLLEIVGSEGLKCTISGATGNKAVVCNILTPGLNPGAEFSVSVKAKALIKTESDLVINNLKIEGTNIEQDKNISQICPAALKIVETVYTKFSCTKDFTSNLAAIEKSEGASVKINSSTTTDKTDIAEGEILFEGDINTIDTLKVLDPLYNFPVFINQNANWLTNPTINEAYPNCLVKTITEGKEINCLLTNLLFESGKNVLDFNFTVSNAAIPNENIINSAALNITVGSQSQTLYCRDTLKVLEKENSVLECSKSFYDENGNKIDDNGKIKAGKKVIAKIEIKNKGNTKLEGITLKDPLDKTFKSEGAKNLNLVEYREVSTSSSDVTKENCKMNEEKDEVSCNNISINPGETTTLVTLLKTNDNSGDKEEIVNVAKVEYINSQGVKLEDYCKDSFNIKAEDSATHSECYNQSCIEVDGEGSNTCTTNAECSYTTCEGSSCVQKECKSGNCNSNCTTDNNCTAGQQTHLTCEGQACTQVLGAGVNKCSDNNDCALEVQKPIPDTGKNDYSIYLAITALAIGLFVSIALLRKSKI